MGKWSASDFLKDFNNEYIAEEDDNIEIEKNDFIEKKKFENYSEGDIINEIAIPLFEITYIEDSGFGVYSCRDEDDNKFSIKGSFPRPLRIGKTYSIEGKIETYNSKFGKEKQLVVEKIESALPTSKEGIIGYLQTLKGLKKRANDIYEVYGDKSLEILKEKPLEVANMITGIGKQSVLSWQAELLEIEDKETELIYLMEIGLKPHQANILYKKYEEKIIEKINKNPYILAKELERFGFLKADEIARNMGYELDNENRIKEGVVYALNQATNSGHCYLPYQELIEKASELLTIKLTINEMNKFAKEYISDFDYKIGEQVVKIDYYEMIKLLNKHNLSKYNNYRYEVFIPVESKIEEQIKTLNLENRIIIESNRVYLEQFYHAEVEVAHYVNRIVDLEKKINWNIDEELEVYCKEKSIELEEKQKEAVIKFASSTGGMHILNGSAGCGKTFTLKIIVDMLKTMYRRLGDRAHTLLLAPTGKASKVATKATGMDCKTIHRGLKYSPMSGFEFNSSNPLDDDIIIVDETSMLDIMLAKHLLSAVKFGAKVIFLGDTKQLPSVGPGNVLNDLIKSNKVNTITLTVPKRQKAQSGVIANANNIIEGKMIKNQDTKDAFHIKVSSVREARDELISLFERINKFKGYSFNQIQLLCPQRVGPIGTDCMNYLLQQRFNKVNSSEKILNKKVSDGEKDVNLFFKKGDKVIHTKNNYDIYWYDKVNFGYSLMGEEFVGITNGECGVIEEINKEKDENGKEQTKVIVKYDDMYIIYEDGVDELDHAYALTVHKYQGSQSPVIIAPIMMTNYIMLDNNLFYTLYTRAESFITIVGENRAIEHAIKTRRSKHRNTSLDEFL